MRQKMNPGRVSYRSRSGASGCVRRETPVAASAGSPGPSAWPYSSMNWPDLRTEGALELQLLQYPSQSEYTLVMAKKAKKNDVQSQARRLLEAARKSQGNQGGAKFSQAMGKLTLTRQARK